MLQTLFASPFTRPPGNSGHRDWAACWRALSRRSAIVAVAVAVACGGTGDVPASTTQDVALPSSLDRSSLDRGRAARKAETAARSAPSHVGGVPRRTGAGVGFRTHAQANQHFEKHGAEFGRVTEAEYVRQAQALRDAPLGGAVEELRRSDGTISRYDRVSGAFVAFDTDGTIRTFFKPNTGMLYGDAKESLTRLVEGVRGA